MSWKTFSQIVLLMIIVTLLIYIVYPKYYFGSNNIGKVTSKSNKITGQIKGFSVDELQKTKKGKILNTEELLDELDDIVED